MEVSVIGSSQAKLGKSDLVIREQGFCFVKESCRIGNNRVSFGGNMRWKKDDLRFSLRAVHHAEPVLEKKKKSHSGSGTGSSDSVSFLFWFCFV